MIQFIVYYLLTGLIIGILSINLTHDSIKSLTCNVFGRPIDNSYRNLCFNIILSSLFVWPVYLVSIVVPRLFFYLKDIVVHLFILRK